MRTARALEQLPRVSDAMSRGELSFAKVRSLTRVANAESENELLEFAKATTAAELERFVRSYRRDSTLDEVERARIRHGSRTLSVFPDDDGMYLVRGRLDPEVGALLMRAIEAASDAGDRAGTAPSRCHGAAERSLAAGFGHARCRSEWEAAVEDCECEPAAPDASLSDEPCDAESACDCNAVVDRSGSAASNDGDSVPVSGTRAERYMVVLHVEPATLEWGGEGGRAELDDGTRLSAETCRRLSCDASVVRVTHDGAGGVLDVGRKTRTIPGALRRALEVRDRGCRFPGCGLRFTDGHHIIHRWNFLTESGRVNR